MTKSKEFDEYCALRVNHRAPESLELTGEDSEKISLTSGGIMAAMSTSAVLVLNLSAKLSVQHRNTVSQFHLKRGGVGVVGGGGYGPGKWLTDCAPGYSKHRD